MKTTIDSAGRVVIPKRIRDQAGLTPGMELEVTWRDGRIEVEPAEVFVRIEERNGFLVGVPTAKGPMLTLEDVEQMLDEDRVGRFMIDADG